MVDVGNDFDADFEAMYGDESEQTTSDESVEKDQEVVVQPDEAEAESEEEIDDGEAEEQETDEDSFEKLFDDYSKEVQDEKSQQAKDQKQQQPDQTQQAVSQLYQQQNALLQQQQQMAAVIQQQQQQNQALMQQIGMLIRGEDPNKLQQDKMTHNEYEQKLRKVLDGYNKPIRDKLEAIEQEKKQAQYRQNIETRTQQILGEATKQAQSLIPGFDELSAKEKDLVKSQILNLASINNIPVDRIGPIFRRHQATVSKALYRGLRKSKPVAPKSPPQRAGAIKGAEKKVKLSGNDFESDFEKLFG